MAFPAALPSANKVVVFKLRGQTLPGHEVSQQRF